MQKIVLVGYAYSTLTSVKSDQVSKSTFPEVWISITKLNVDNC